MTIGDVTNGDKTNGAVTNGDSRYRTADVPVRGGNLRVGIWDPEPPAAESAGAGPTTDERDVPTILAIHGVTASHRCWDMLAKQLPGCRMIAPDLRGRGRSNTLPGPYGMVQHADDVAAALDALGIGRAVVVGHSMGGFVSVMFAHRYADRLGSLVLVDGGMPLWKASDTTTQALLEALGPAAERLTMTFADHQAYQQFWRVHPAFADHWSKAVTDYIDYDLVGIPPELHPATSVAAMAADIPDQYGTPAMMVAVENLPDPTIFLRAPRGFLDDEPGIYTPDWIRHWQERLPALDVRVVDGVNHYTIVFIDRGVAAVKAAVLESIRRPQPHQ